MAIQPKYAQAILSGDKTVEFRKRGLAPDISMVLVYETSPTQRIVGAFEVTETVRRTPTGLWRQFGAVGSIARPDFMDYYAAHQTAVGLVVSSVVRFRRPVELRELDPTPAVPQSFSYVSAEVFAQIEDIQSTAQPAPHRAHRGVVRRVQLTPA